MLTTTTPAALDMRQLTGFCFGKERGGGGGGDDVRWVDVGASLCGEMLLNVLRCQLTH